MLSLPENGDMFASERACEIAAETERQAKLIIAYSKNASDILRAHQVLVFLYTSQGEYEKAGAEKDIEIKTLRPFEAAAVLW